MSEKRVFISHGSTHRVTLGAIRNANAKLIREGVVRSSERSGDGIVINVTHSGIKYHSTISPERINSAFKAALEKHGS